MPPLLIAAFEELGLGTVTEGAVAAFNRLVAAGASEAAAAEAVAGTAAAPPGFAVTTAGRTVAIPTGAATTAGRTMAVEGTGRAALRAGEEAAARTAAGGAARAGVRRGTTRAATAAGEEVAAEAIKNPGLAHKLKGAFSLENLISLGVIMPVGQYAVDRLTHGSPRQQMLEQLEIQDEFARTHGQGGGGAQSPEAGLLAQAAAIQGQEPQSSYDLQDQYERTKDLADIARQMYVLRNTHPVGDNKRLMDLIGSDARIAQLTSERVLTPAEIRQRAMAVMGLDDQ